MFRRIILFAVFVGLRIWFYRIAVTPEASVWILVAGHVLTVLATLSFAILVDGALKYFFWEGYLKRVLGMKVPQLLRHTVTIILYATVLINLLKYDFGISLAGALAASGFVAIILGFALRSVILDLFSGLAISVDKSYVVGDWVTVTSRDFLEPIYGKVEDIGWRTTRLRLEDQTLFIMPNSLGGAFSITNHSQPRGAKRVEFTVTLPHETPSDRAYRLLSGAVIKAMRGEGYFLDPEPRILMKKIGKDGVDYLIRFFVDVHKNSPTTALSHVTTAVHTAVLQNRLSFPGEKVEIQNRWRAHKRAKEVTVDAYSALKQIPLFAMSLNSQELRELAGGTKAMHFEEGEVLIEQGKEGSSLFVLLTGAASVFLSNGRADPSNLATLSSGDVVGEMSLLTGMPRSASVIAETSLDVLEIKKEDLEPFLAKRPEIAEALSMLLAKRELEQKAAHADDLIQANLDSEVAKENFLSSIKNFFAL